MNTDNIDINQLQQMKQIEEMKKQVLNKILTKEALERLSRVRVVNPQLVAEVEVYLLQIFQAGKIQARITDEKLREVLTLLSQKKKTRITRK